MDDEVDAALLLDKFEHTASHHRDNDQFAHREDTFTHGAKPSVDVEGTREQSDNACEDDAHGKHGHDVHAEDGRDEDYQIRQYLDPLNGRQLSRRMNPLSHQ